MERKITTQIEEYDQQYNRCYFSIYAIIEEKGFRSSKKTYNYSQVVNIAVYDIHLKTTTYLFERLNEGETIISFLFEAAYNENQQFISYRDSIDHHQIAIRNNQNIEKRALANRLWVLTTSAGTPKRTYKLWSFEKNGQQKRFVAEFDEDTTCRMDVWNQRIRLTKYVSNQIEIQDFDY